MVLVPYMDVTFKEKKYEFRFFCSSLLFRSWERFLLLGPLLIVISCFFLAPRSFYRFAARIIVECHCLFVLLISFIFLGDFTWSEDELWIMRKWFQPEKKNKSIHRIEIKPFWTKLWNSDAYNSWTPRYKNRSLTHVFDHKIPFFSLLIYLYKNVIEIILDAIIENRWCSNWLQTIAHPI